MATDIEILKKAQEREDDKRRPPQWKSWEFWVVGATKDDIKRLVDQGYVTAAVRQPRLTKYLLTDKGRQVVWSASMERKFTAVPRSTLMESMELVVGFEDIKETLADAIAQRRRINFMLEGPPACAKSVILECVRTCVPYAYMAFGSRTSAAGLSDVLFEIKPELLLLDEVDKMRHDCYSVLLGLMEKGEILETKSGKTRGIVLDTMVIAACNSSKKMSPEFLSRFAFHPYFKEYTRQEFIDVCVGMLTRVEGCPPDVAHLIGVQVYDMGLGDVRKARGVWQLMRAPTEEEVQRIIRMNLKYSPELDTRKVKRQGVKLPGF
ncbi:MAG: AAA family ATPase [Dehalococcoidales bacterium]|nr:AAA family ATPase [Dehalococcoidales bacterium]